MLRVYHLQKSFFANKVQICINERQFTNESYVLWNFDHLNWHDLTKNIAHINTLFNIYTYTSITLKC